MKKRYSFWITLFLGGLWGMSILWSFFHHFPLINGREVVLNGLMLVILLGFFTALGRRVLRLIQMQFLSFAEEVCFSFAIGTGVMMLLIFGLAVFGGLYKLLIIVLAAILLLLVYQDTKDLCFRGYRAIMRYSFKSAVWHERILLLLIGFAGLTSFLAAATPPFFYDALVYHLAVPQMYLARHGFYYLPYHHFSNFPMNLGLLFIVAMSFSGGMLAQLLAWSYAPLTALAVYGFVRSRWGRPMAMTAAAITSLVPGILILSTLTSVDNSIMFYSFLSLAAFLSWCTSRQGQWFMLSGICCGLAVGIKYTAIPLTLFPLGCLILVHEWVVAKRSLLSGIRKAVVFAAIVGCINLPWFGKNLLYTGNPIYPLLNTLIGTSAPLVRNYDQYFQRHSPLVELMNVVSGTQPFRSAYWFNLVIGWLKSPWSVTMTTTRAAGKTGVIFLLFLPGILFIKPVQPVIRYLLAIAGGAFGLWLLLFPGNALRYVFLIFPPLSIATAYILYQSPISSRSRTWLLSGVSLLLVYHLALFLQETLLLRPFGYLFGNQTQEEFLVEHGVNYYPVIEYVNTEAALRQAKILFVAEARGYYCERSYILSTNEADDQEAIILRKLITESQNVEDVIRKLQRMGVTHLLVNYAELERFSRDIVASGRRASYFDLSTAKDREIFQQLFSAQYVRPVLNKHDVVLYELPGR